MAWTSIAGVFLPISGGSLISGVSGPSGAVRSTTSMAPDASADAKSPRTWVLVIGCVSVALLEFEPSNSLPGISVLEFRSLGFVASGATSRKPSAIILDMKYLRWQAGATIRLRPASAHFRASGIQFGLASEPRSPSSRDQRPNAKQEQTHGL